MHCALRCATYGISQYSSSRYDLLPYAHTGTYLRYYLRTSICNYLQHCRSASLSVLTGMPPAAMLPSMLVELTCYALISSLLMKFIHTKKSVADLYISLIGALLIGRVIAGIVKALIFARGEITITAWATSYFVTCLPGIIMQIILVPVIYASLVKANLIPSRYVYSEE